VISSSVLLLSFREVGRGDGAGKNDWRWEIGMGIGRAMMVRVRNKDMILGREYIDTAYSEQTLGGWHGFGCIQERWDKDSTHMCAANGVFTGLGIGSLPLWIGWYIGTYKTVCSPSPAGK